MPGPVWKSKVRQVGSSIDRCREQIDRLERLDQVDKFKKEIFSNANTRVEVSIKTKNPDKNWASLMSGADSSPEVIQRRKPMTTPRGLPARTLPGKKLTSRIEGKHFAQPTKSSRDKRFVPQRVTPKADEDQLDGEHGVADVVQHRFQNRTLKIFLREMRLALAEDNMTAASKILDDLEYVAENLKSPNPSRQKSTHHDELDSHKASASKSSSSLTKEQKEQIYDLTKVKTELKQLMDENKKLKKELIEMDRRLVTSKTSHEETVANLKLIISRLTTNNNDMLAILATKANIEDNVKRLDSENLRLSLELEMQKKKNEFLESQVLQDKSESKRMQRIISDLKSSLNHNIRGGSHSANRDGRHPVTINESTIDLELSSSEASSHHGRHTPLKGGDDADDRKDADADSAIGEGISESHPLSGASAVPASTKPEETGAPPVGQQLPHMFPPSNPDLVRHVPDAQNLSSSMVHSTPAQFRLPNSKPPPAYHAALTQMSAATSSGPVPRFPADDPLMLSSSFHAASLDLSHTHDEDNDTISESSSKKNLANNRRLAEEVATKASLAAAAQHVDDKVKSFLERLRNDEKFQISLSSNLPRSREPLSSIGDLTGLTSNPDSTLGMDNRHVDSRHVGVGDTLNLSHSTNNDL